MSIIFFKISEIHFYIIASVWMTIISKGLGSWSGEDYMS